MARSLSFYGDGVGFQLVSGQSLTQGPSWGHVHCSAKMDSSEDSGRLVGHMIPQNLDLEYMVN